ncbi:hypothetical protein BOTBODRAFT_29692 [Botryobasidium botryosum FD-172 SS1]|uniref:Major facilitator superfamily (MFS) profile domain-containing protein n=1 Tax=Botryobasidium botryosum (strain FD-172 SS1) TaxID=930990 RepID=A0A067N025_BOTB1|nr:hypothetical protein BOTBODRAFT_29692 [Botryobasidium botryosum FD-172 SS1]
MAASSEKPSMDTARPQDSKGYDPTIDTLYEGTPQLAANDGGAYAPPRKGFRGLYTHPFAQTILLGVVCFMGPGLFNALNGLGAGGQVDSATSANGNAALYATFSVAAFFAGSITNRLGSKLTLLIGSTGYSVYVASYLVANIKPSAQAFLIAAGAFLGFTAGLLWSAQGSLMLAYPTESNKGLYIATFWAIFNLGGVIGAVLALALNSKSKESVVTDETYIIFLVLTGIGMLTPLFMANPSAMYRTDGSKVAAPRHPSWKTEIWSLFLSLRTDPYIILLFPMFFGSNYFYTWQFNNYNGAVFNIRTRSLNNLCYWLSQIFGSVIIGMLLDSRRFARRTRAFLAWGVLMAMIFIVHGWAYIYQRHYTRRMTMSSTFHHMDMHDHGYAGRVLLYVLCGILDAQWQTTAYWMLGAMSNDPAKLAIFTGFYKSLQAAGGAVAWRTDAVKLPFMNIFVTTWTLLVAGLLFAFPMLYMRVKDFSEAEEEYDAQAEGEGDDGGSIQANTTVVTHALSRVKTTHQGQGSGEK